MLSIARTPLPLPRIGNARLDVKSHYLKLIIRDIRKHNYHLPPFIIFSHSSVLSCLNNTNSGTVKPKK